MRRGEGEGRAKGRPLLPWSLLRRLRWWQHAWSFEWAHHPLCERFERDVLKPGKLHLCRSCTALWLGVLVGIVAVLAAGLGSIAHGWLLALVGPAVAVASWPRIHHHLPRAGKDLARFATGLLPPAAIALALGSPLVGGAVIALGVSAYFGFARLRSRERSRRCDGCPEALAGGICSGYAVQANAVRAWEERLAADYLARRPLPDRASDG